jgi:hypothetical protein
MGHVMRVGFVSVVAVLVFGAAPTRAASLIVSGGELMGATGVSVNGTFYDVEFVEGTCVELFEKCDQLSDFAFTTQADALAASDALLEQVMLDSVGHFFDSQPELTAGCSDIVQCWAHTPYGFAQGGARVQVGVAANRSPDAEDFTSPSTLEISHDTLAGLNAEVFVYARWTPANPAAVPEPSSLGLLGFGVLGLLAKARRRKPPAPPA